MATAGPEARVPVNVNVRLATIDDAERIAEVHVRSWQSAYPGLMPQPYLDAQDVTQRATQWQRWLLEPPPRLHVFVADHADDGPAGGARPKGIVGFAVVSPYRVEDGEAHPGEHVGELGAIYALADHWGTGVGRGLMDAAVAALADEGYTEAVLWVIEGNARARRFYEAAGWEPDGATKLDQRGGWDIPEVRYRRALADSGHGVGQD
jgi:GNAT superfamily N-acetyltransferase